MLKKRLKQNYISNTQHSVAKNKIFKYFCKNLY